MNRASRTSSGIQLSVVLAFLLLAHTAVDRWQVATTTPAIDLFTFWSVPHTLALKPGLHIYDGEDQRQMRQLLVQEADTTGVSRAHRTALTVTSQLYNNRVDATGSPFLYTLIGTMSSGDYDRDLKTFALVSLAAYAISVLLLGRVLRFSLLTTLLALSILASAYAPISSDVGVGNVNQIQLLAVTLFIFFMARGQRLAGGLALGVGVMLKPTLLTLVVLSVVVAVIDRDLRRQIATYAGVALSAVVCLGWSSAYLGRAGLWVEFVRSIPHTLNSAYPVANGNFGFSMLVLSLTSIDVSFVVGLALLAAFAFVIFSTRPAASDTRPDADLHMAFAIAGAGSAIMILSSDLVWLHYYVLLIPVALYLLRPDDTAGAPMPRILAAAALMMLTAIVHALVEGVLRNQMLEAFILNAAALLMLALALSETWHRRLALASDGTPSRDASAAAAPRGAPRRRGR